MTRVLVTRRTRRVLVGTAGLFVVGGIAPTVASASWITELTSALLGVRIHGTHAPAQKQAASWRGSRPSDAALMEEIARQPVARWFGGWNRDVRRDVASAVSGTGAAVPVLVAYNIPSRDCGSHSAGGVANGDRYRSWIRDFAAGLNGKKAIVVLEPDAVAGANCLSESARSDRYAMLADAIVMLKKAGGVVYLDAGHPKWQSDSEMASRLKRAGIANADGFALNVSNFLSTELNVAYGSKLSARLGGKHYIIDTSRNGMGGVNGQWCNPRGQALGQAPTTRTGHQLVDALLWIKTPGESDGKCNGGPAAGQWLPEYALELARNARGTTVAAR